MRRIAEEQIDGVEVAMREKLNALRSTKRRQLQTRINEIAEELFDFEYIED
jgi:hypothetical protein